VTFPASEEARSIALFVSTIDNIKFNPRHTLPRLFEARDGIVASTSGLAALVNESYQLNQQVPRDDIPNLQIGLDEIVSGSSRLAKQRHAGSHSGLAGSRRGVTPVDTGNA
jgi:hypothetical protein